MNSLPLPLVFSVFLVPSWFPSYFLFAWGLEQTADRNCRSFAGDGKSEKAATSAIITRSACRRRPCRPD